jgi:hypothetical protein
MGGISHHPSTAAQKSKEIEKQTIKSPLEPDHCGKPKTDLLI